VTLVIPLPASAGDNFPSRGEAQAGLQVRGVVGLPGGGKARKLAGERRSERVAVGDRVADGSVDHGIHPDRSNDAADADRADRAHDGIDPYRTHNATDAYRANRARDRTEATNAVGTYRPHTDAAGTAGAPVVSLSH